MPTFLYSLIMQDDHPNEDGHNPGPENNENNDIGNDEENDDNDNGGNHCDDDNAPETPDADLPVDVVQELHSKIALLEQKVANCEEISNEPKNGNKILLEQQFSVDKIKDDDSAVFFTLVSLPTNH